MARLRDCRRHSAHARQFTGRVRLMVEVVAALLGLFSAGIFLAHAVVAYRAE